MTLRKVRQLLRQDFAQPGSINILDLKTARAIAIEATTRILAWRTPGIHDADRLLPGETRE